MIEEVEDERKEGDQMLVEEDEIVRIVSRLESLLMEDEGFRNCWETPPPLNVIIFKRIISTYELYC